MKFSLLAFLFVTLVMMQATLTNIMRFLGHSFSPMISALLLVSVGMHPDTVQSILWISNGNELLMVFFYLIAAYLISAVISGKKEPGYGIMAATVFAYILSILTKQQSLHLPLVIFLFLWIYRKSVSAYVRRYLRTTSAIMLIAMIIVLAINAELFINRDVTGSLFFSWWKKPFAMAGTIIYLLFPLYGWELYSWFMKNTVVTMTITGISAIVIILYICIKSVDVKKWLYFCAICMIFFFPRISLPAQDRVNVMLVFTIIPLIFIIASNVKTISKYVLIVISIMIIYSGFNTFRSFSKGIEYFTKANRDLIDYRSGNDIDQFTIAYTHPLLPTQHSLYYFKHSSFGIDTSLILPGIGIRNMFHWASIPDTVSVNRIYDTLIYRIYASEEYLNLEPNHRSDYTIYDSINGFRGYTYLKVKMNDKIGVPSHYLIYSDTGWVTLYQ
jgi:hypothetical protein